MKLALYPIMRGTTDGQLTIDTSLASAHLPHDLCKDVSRPSLQPASNSTINAHMTHNMRLLTVQYMGDYRDAYNCLSNGGEETYYGQRASIDFVAELGREIEQVGVLCCRSHERYDEVVGNRVRAMGAAWTDRSNIASVIGMIERFRPSHLIVNTPNLAIFKWAMQRSLPVFPLIADTFNINTTGLSPLRRLARRWRHRWRNRRLASTLNDSRIRWVSNHNINACRALVELGVRPEKIVPWDWPPIHRPETHAPKTLAVSGGSWDLVFVGSVAESKGIGDAIDSLAELKSRGCHAKMTIIGSGDIPLFVRRAESIGVGDLTRFEGPQPHSRVMEAMRSADLVLVPSWHDCPEGLPMVIYEALAVRTPLVCSDHPAFRGRIGEGKASLTFPERCPAALADVVLHLLNDPALYAQMSVASAAVWEQLQCPVKRDDLIRRWLCGGPENEQWLAKHSLARLEGDAKTNANYTARSIA